MATCNDTFLSQSPTPSHPNLKRLETGWNMNGPLFSGNCSKNVKKTWLANGSHLKAPSKARFVPPTLSSQETIRMARISFPTRSRRNNMGSTGNLTKEFTPTSMIAAKPGISWYDVFTGFVRGSCYNYLFGKKDFGNSFYIYSKKVNTYLELWINLKVHPNKHVHL